MLEALNALVALQPNACGSRLASANALPHLARWLKVSLDEYFGAVPMEGKYEEDDKQYKSNNCLAVLNIRDPK